MIYELFPGRRPNCYICVQSNIHKTLINCPSCKGTAQGTVKGTAKDTFSLALFTLPFHAFFAPFLAISLKIVNPKYLLKTLPPSQFYLECKESRTDFKPREALRRLMCDGIREPRNQWRVISSDFPSNILWDQALQEKQFRCLFFFFRYRLSQGSTSSLTLLVHYTSTTYCIYMSFQSCFYWFFAKIKFWTMSSCLGGLRNEDIWLVYEDIL